jgi:hypothetical protein
MMTSPMPWRSNVHGLLVDALGGKGSWQVVGRTRPAGRARAGGRGCGRWAGKAGPRRRQAAP